MSRLTALTTAGRRTTLSVLSLLVALAAALTVFVVTNPPSSGRVLPSISADGAYHVGSLPNDQGESALKVAVAALPLALSYDYRNLAKGLASATAQMTTGFGAQFSKTFDATVVPQARAEQAVANALVRGAGLVSQDGDHATCLVYVNQVLVSSTTMRQRQTPVKVTQSRVLVELTRQSGHWLVDSIEPL